jgi:hypothetical protein
MLQVVVMLHEEGMLHEVVMLRVAMLHEVVMLGEEMAHAEVIQGAVKQAFSSQAKQLYVQLYAQARQDDQEI